MQIKYIKKLTLKFGDDFKKTYSIKCLCRIQGLS